MQDEECSESCERQPVPSLERTRLGSDGDLCPEKGEWDRTKGDESGDSPTDVTEPRVHNRPRKCVFTHFSITQTTNPHFRRRNMQWNKTLSTKIEFRNRLNTRNSNARNAVANLQGHFVLAFGLLSFQYYSVFRNSFCDICTSGITLSKPRFVFNSRRRNS